MSISEGNHNELAGHQRADKSTTATFTLQDMPSELILRIASFLEVRDLLALRRSQRSMYSLSQDQLLWRGLLRNLCLPLPRILRSRCLESLSYPELEEAVLDSCRVENQWLKRREVGLTTSTIWGNFNIRFLNFLHDRWVLSIPNKGPPTIWDTRESPPKLCKRVLPSFRGFTLAAVDPHQGDTIIAVWDGPSTIRVIRAHLTEPGSDSLTFTDDGVAGLPDGMLLALEPSKGAVIMRLPGVGIEVRDWTRSRSVVVKIAGADSGNASVPILGLRSVGDYIVSFRPRWTELSYIPPFSDADEQFVSEHDPAPCHFHLHRKVVFESASLSEPQPNPESPSDSRIVYVLAHQMTVGIFYFRLTIHNPDYAPSGPRARMDVDLVGVYEVDKPQLGMVRGQRMAMSSSLGPEGKRGIWIERLLHRSKAFVVAASFDQSRPAGIPVVSGDNLREIPPRIESTSVVFVLESRNPNYNFFRCAFSESTGKIVLETRDNQMLLL